MLQEMYTTLQVSYTNKSVFLHLLIVRARQQQWQMPVSRKLFIRQQLLPSLIGRILYNLSKMLQKYDILNLVNPNSVGATYWGTYTRT